MRLRVTNETKVVDVITAAEKITMAKNSNKKFNQEKSKKKVIGVTDFNTVLQEQFDKNEKLEMKR